MLVEPCEKCKHGVDRLYGLEKDFEIYKWVCENCFFKQLHSKEKQELSRRDSRLLI